jgi:hypothetical protein
MSSYDFRSKIAGGRVRMVIGTILVAALLAALPGFGQSNEDSSRIAAAVLPLPESLRPTATVVKIENGTETVLRKGSNGIVCSADQPGDAFFYVACFHETFRALNRRAAELSRELKVTGKALDEVLDREIKAGKLKLPLTPSIGFQMRGPVSGYDAATNTVSKEIKTWQMVILPYATGASLSLPERPESDMPWVMYAGSVLAHIMIEH